MINILDKIFREEKYHNNKWKLSTNKTYWYLVKKNKIIIRILQSNISRNFLVISIKNKLWFLK